MADGDTPAPADQIPVIHLETALHYGLESLLPDGESYLRQS